MKDIDIKRMVCLLGGLLIVACFSMSAVAQENPPPKEAEKILLFDEFILLGISQDTEFEQILIDALALKYQKNLRLPAKDLVLSVKQRYEIFLNQDREAPDTTVELSKLFPYTGTRLSASYEVGTSISSAREAAELSFTIAQPIAENAFGRSTRLLDKIVGLEVDVASYQIIEAYEDYLATIMTAYYTWYEDYENLLIGQSSYRENLKLLDNIHERQKQKIALPIDVNKVSLQVMAKKERLVELEEKYKNSLHVIERTLRYDGAERLVPREPPSAFESLNEDFDRIFKEFSSGSRTFEILKKLEERSSLQVAHDADDLLPSISLLAGYEVSGEKYSVTGEDSLVFAGISMAWPFPDQVEKAEYEISKVAADKTKLSTVNTYYRLYAQLANLYLQIEREKELGHIAGEKIDLARAILTDEAENYSFGKVTLNDYIQAVNDLDATRFNKIFHDSQYKKFLVEWLRLRDQLVNQKEITPKIKGLENKKRR